MEAQPTESPRCPEQFLFLRLKLTFAKIFPNKTFRKIQNIGILYRKKRVGN